ncbi:MAG: hypothetical protein FJY55_15920 [Betaproteobacteria bacterium]|nr:hypothetical protein [Betaproteobacteria bacterium]
MAETASLRHRLRCGALAAAALLLGGCDFFRPFEEICAQRLGPTRIEVETAPITYTTDFSKSTQELSRRGAASTGRRVLGLTLTNLKWSASLGSQGIMQRIGGQHCLRPSIKVRLAFEPMTVLVGREFAPGSCIFDITMGHELKHVATYERFLPRAQAAVQRELEARFGQRIFTFDSEAEAERQVHALTRDYVAPFVDRSMQEVTALQAAVDSPEEYFRLDTFQAACPS